MRETLSERLSESCRHCGLQRWTASPWIAGWHLQPPTVILLQDDSRVVSHHQGVGFRNVRAQGVGRSNAGSHDRSRRSMPSGSLAIAPIPARKDTLKTRKQGQLSDQTTECHERRHRGALVGGQVVAPNAGRRTLVPRSRDVLPYRRCGRSLSLDLKRWCRCSTSTETEVGTPIIVVASDS